MLQKLIKETESLEKMKDFSPNHPSLPVQYVFRHYRSKDFCKVMRMVQKSAVNKRYLLSFYENWTELL